MHCVVNLNNVIMFIGFFFRFMNYDLYMVVYCTWKIIKCLKILKTSMYENDNVIVSKCDIPIPSYDWYILCQKINTIKK